MLFGVITAMQRRLFVFSGLAGGASRPDWLQWDGRSGHAMAFDPVTRRLVLFGGFGSGVLGDTWVRETGG